MLLIDDVAAELDGSNKENLLDTLAEMNVQMFLSSIEQDTLAAIVDKRPESRMFHVEHGEVSKVV